MTTGWPVKRLSELSAISYGYTESASADPIGPKFLRITDIQNGAVDWDAVPFCKIEADEYQKHKLKHGDIVFARTGATTGKSFLVREPPDAVPASYLIRLRAANKTLRPEFLAYYFLSDVYWDAVSAGLSGSAQGGFNASKLSNLEVPIPELTEQRRIVAILDEAFAAIATAAANAEKNLKNVETLFERCLRSVFTNARPNWKEIAVGDVADCSLGKMLDKNKNRGELKPYLRNLNVRWFAFALDDISSMRFEEGEVARYSIERGDVVICEGGYPGRAAIWMNDEPIYFQKALHRVRFGNAMYSEWLVHYLFHLEASGELRRHFTGTGIQHFTGQALKALKMPFPPEDELVRMIAELHELRQAIKKLEELYRTKLAWLRRSQQSILKKVFSGGLPSGQEIKAAAE